MRDGSRTPNNEPDANCITTPDGGCIGTGCMHDVKPEPKPQPPMWDEEWEDVA